ncbi:MAG: TonB-dependent receptor plug domain-containing protein, partial [Flavobacteriales bacterium]
MPTTTTTTTTTTTVRLNHKPFPLFLLTLFLGLASTTFSQSSGSLRGKVLFESHDGQDVGPGHADHEPEYESLPGAYVRWSRDVSHVEVTDGFGFFKISGGILGDTLLVSMVGYQTAGLVYTGQSYVDIPLEPGVELGAAEVSAKKSATSISLLDPLNIQSLNRKELAKAACCNLSEAFETNASVDASFTDAVTGTRQIRMLGLDGKYSQIQVDNLPGPRGLNVIQGLMIIPGDWVNEIHISKGAGTATQGHESMTGQINVALKNPETADPLHLNIYTNSGGRLEFNHVSKHAISRRWSTAILGHALMNNTLNDRNDDGFLDNPLKRNFIGRNEWKLMGDRGMRGEYSVNYAQTESAGGQTMSYGSAADWPAIRDMMTTPDSSWSAITNIDRLELT